ncbi:5' nucleotidase, NT5C type [Spongiibacter marinus]|uniref:5' nucleotidase, NT5C type n=2 Tax=Spongiibacter TaxID=630749 RepID=UPI0019617949|nr:hypothetical protein [uncultured Alcanivorax sp.]MBM7425002.1 5'(3')-deoxyribonucleotidase [Spongiibacter marinus]
MADRKQTIIYVDMDHVLCDYAEGFSRQKDLFPDLQFPQSEEPGMYIGLNPLPGAIESYHWLNDLPETDVYILTAPSIHNSHCYSEKRDWVEKHLGLSVVQNLIITPHKNLNKGHYLIDDMPSGKGQDRFEGSLIQFGSEQFPDWESVRTFFEIMLKPSPASKVADTWDSFFNSEDTVTEDFGLKQEDRDWLNMRPVGREKPD